MDCEREKTANDIVQVSRLMYRNRMVNAFEGNVSARWGTEFLFTPSAVCKGFLEPDMLVAADMDGNVLYAKQGYTLTSEAKMHLEIYRLRPDAASIVHTHSPWATAYAIANRPIRTRAYPEMIVLFGEIPVARYGTPSTDEISRDFPGLLAGTDVMLLANHGVVSLGKDVFDAYFKMEAVESCAHTLALAELLGGPANLDEASLARLNAMREARGGKAEDN